MVSEDSQFHFLTRRVSLSTDWDVEASLTVDESRDPVTQVMRDPIKPVRGTGPFLLIVRTGRIFTVHHHNQRTVVVLNEYRRILGVSSIWPASHCKITLARGNPRARFRGVYLRTVIVH